MAQPNVESSFKSIRRGASGPVLVSLTWLEHREYWQVYKATLVGISEAEFTEGMKEPAFTYPMWHAELVDGTIIPLLDAFVIWHPAIQEFGVRSVHYHLKRVRDTKTTRMIDWMARRWHAFQNKRRFDPARIFGKPGSDNEEVWERLLVALARSGREDPAAALILCRIGIKSSDLQIRLAALSGLCGVLAHWHSLADQIESVLIEGSPGFEPNEKYQSEHADLLRKVRVIKGRTP